MINNLDQLKNFIMWCKDNKIKDMQLKDVKFTISELDFLPDNNNVQSLNSNLGEYNTSTLTDTIEESIDWRDDEDLYHSAR